LQTELRITEGSAVRWATLLPTIATMIACWDITFAAYWKTWSPRS
jgi:hypothetical protein